MCHAPGSNCAENCSDFGFTLNYKVTARLKVAFNFNIRESVSADFHASSLEQINFSSIFTTVQGGNIAKVRFVTNYFDITCKACIPEFTQGKSTNTSIDFTWKATPEFSFTFDGYWVSLKDRLVHTSQFDASDSDLNLELAKILQDNNFALAHFFSVAVNTKNRGLDIVIDYTKRRNENMFKALFTDNWQNMEITSINVPAELTGQNS